jgi:hypothetical protein
MSKNRKVRKFVDMTIYTLRNLVERCFNKLNEPLRVCRKLSDGMTLACSGNLRHCSLCVLPPHMRRFVKPRFEILPKLKCRACGRRGRAEMPPNK